MRAGLAVAFATALSLASCATYHGTSILGHDSIEIPVPSEPTQGGLPRFSVSSKAEVLGSLFTRDSTQFLQGGFTAVYSKKLSESLAWVPGLAGTFYLANTSKWSNNDILGYSGYGVTAEAKQALLLLGGTDRRVLFGIDGLINQEWGDYRDYRQTLKGSNYDISPTGLSGQVTGFVENQFRLGGWGTYGAGIHAGVAYPQFGKFDTNYLGACRA